MPKKVNTTGEIYTQFLKDSQYAADTRGCIEETVRDLMNRETTHERPGMLLGKIQSGKTGTFLGIIALAFDNDYDVAIVLTKGTNALAKQTVSRLMDVFKPQINYYQVCVYDVMDVKMTGLSPYEADQKVILVCKKEDDNLKHLEEIMFTMNPSLSRKRVLIVDDEADYASITFRKTKEGIQVGKLAQQINSLRHGLDKSSFLQVTATPYSLYLQPADAPQVGDISFKPIRPAFTSLVPIHEKYVGGDFYFRESQQEGSIASFLHVQVNPEELIRLKKEDRRGFKLEEVLTSNLIKCIRMAIINFITGAAIRRLQDIRDKKHPKLFSFVLHTEVSKATHTWQMTILETLVEKLKEGFSDDTKSLKPLFKEAYGGLSDSIKSGHKVGIESSLPSFEKVFEELSKTIHYVTVVRVDSNNDVKALLNEFGQLKLTSPYTIFVGGAILDRGLTIENMIGFYYGRSPQKTQQDTVLQHSRMYGARPLEDLLVTRFYTTPKIHGIMRSIHEIDSNLREAFEQGGYEAGVVFIELDTKQNIVPCSPNKILISTTTSLWPRRRLLPFGFQTDYKSHIEKIVKKIDEKFPKEKKEPFLMDIHDAIEIVHLIRQTLCFREKDFHGQKPGDFLEDMEEWDEKAFNAAMIYGSETTPNKKQKGKIWVLVRKDRDLERIRPSGRYANAPDTVHIEGKIADQVAVDLPMLMLFRQNGKKEKGWMGHPFWWPVLRMHSKCEHVVYAADKMREFEED